MKAIRTLLLLSSIICVGFLLPQIASAQNPDICKPDCDTSEFGPTQTVILTVPSGCIVRVKYAQRFACSNWNDVGIISIEILGNCNYPSDPKTMLDMVTDELVISNPMGFPMPDTNQCVTSWRVVKGACWTVEIDCDHDSVYVSCDTVACCLAPMQICRDSAGTISITKWPGFSTAPCDTNKIWCEPVCGESLSTPAGATPDLGFNGRSHSAHGHSASFGETVPLKKVSTHEDPHHQMPDQGLNPLSSEEDGAKETSAGTPDNTR